ncbi:MAG: hypothetical protein SAL07_08130 [Oscillatoria sp. PMC 1051.18]|uniref:hypothetical protein n=1 Tax=Oscillatoria salina TaxID=331517 RepID=UPI0013BD4FFA|nr:hypothetical protein [Oscillatoria salina]MBZ8181459.1 hypothetical protein [Oscillatoria salina IIICB1]MEC4892538.1 hypothetical protein [Oscillatoria sp. PMC 1050.18]MEC5029865.1 hypothetical protein [Oscillatoria sp. PMC 1051.18]NET88415.1 hypothetical protein [Kamptonema sp. SIO1D9]
MNLSKQQTELKIQKGIRQTEDNLVQWIEKALDNKSSYGDLEESQFRNLLRVAETTESSEVIKNFLRYQVGREEKWGRGKNSLAERIIKDIDTQIKSAAEKIAKEADSSEVNLVYIELIRRYLGYGSRCLKYLNSTKSSQN